MNTFLNKTRYKFKNVSVTSILGHRKWKNGLISTRLYQLHNHHISTWMYVCWLKTDKMGLLTVNQRFLARFSLTWTKTLAFFFILHSDLMSWLIISKVSKLSLKVNSDQSQFSRAPVVAAPTCYIQWLNYLFSGLQISVQSFESPLYSD